MFVHMWNKLGSDSEQPFARLYFTRSGLENADMLQYADGYLLSRRSPRQD